MKVLVISSVWVEPTSSAAGSRMLQLLHLFLEQGWSLHYASTAGPSKRAMELTSLGIQTTTIKLNDPSFDVYIRTLVPDFVLFDRFMVEEQFGWRVAVTCPEALRILDTEDLHCLRRARQQAVKEGRAFRESDLISDVAKREIASIYRCDLTLMISQVEMDLLKRFFKVPAALLCYVPFLLERCPKDFKPFEERQHFVSIGNFLHPPNWDAVLVLKEHIWPRIRKELPKAELHVYGAYPSQKVWDLRNEKEGFIMEGAADDACQVLSQVKVLLAPLRFGAGLKGKFIDAMQTGTPSVTTAIGAEGMQQGLPWCGDVVMDDTTILDEFSSAFAKAAITLYTDKATWKQSQERGVAMIHQHFLKEDHAPALVHRLQRIADDLQSHRQANFTGLMLQHHTLQSSKYLSKWIEEKNRKL